MSPSVRRARQTAGLAAAVALALGAAVLAPSTATASASPAPVPICSSIPFRSDAAKHVWYRIPAIVRTNAGTLLAFAERRDSDAPSSDTGTTSIVEARSVDAGCSWSAPATVASRGSDTVGNPAPVVDTITGDVLLLSVDRPQGGTSIHGLHVQRSTDGGRTFTPYGASGYDLYGQPGWSGGLTGPGHAIQLTTGPHAGRLVVPIGYGRDSDHRIYGIISDDHGATWRIGFNQTGSAQQLEATLAQLPDGRIWVSDHDQSSAMTPGTGRYSAVVSDDATRLTTRFGRLALPVVSVEGSALELTGTHRGELLFSTPGTADPSVRRVMTIFTTTAAVPGSSWTRYPVTLDDTPASYSDLVQLDDATVGVLYETGSTSWHDHISFHSVRISALTAGRTVSSRIASTVPARTVAGGTAHIGATVTVPGTKAPAGKVTVRVSKKGWSKTVTLTLYSTNGGHRVAAVARIPKGTYTVHVTYSGSPRIHASAAKDRTMKVG